MMTKYVNIMQWKMSWMKVNCTDWIVPNQPGWGISIKHSFFSAVIEK